MSDILFEDNDFLDGCELDFTIDPDDDLTASLRPLFPAGEDDAGLEGAWRELFDNDEIRRIAPLSAAAYQEEIIRGYSSGFDVGIADRLRAFGLKVVECVGWKTRGSTTFNPKGSVDHHTAGPLSGNAPSLGVCINGRSDLPGPLCNVFIARDNTCYVVAAGRANHAGTGGWNGLSGNSSVYGVEHENTGTGNEPWRTDQRDTAAKVHAALLSGIGRNGDWVCEHKEWTTRKIDKWDQSGADMRARTKSFAPVAPVPVPNVPNEEDEEVTQVLWFEGRAAYAVNGLIAKYLPRQQLVDVLKFFGAKEHTNITADLYDGLVIVDGPYCNTFGKRIEEWGQFLTGKVEANSKRQEEWGSYLDSRTQAGFAQIMAKPTAVVGVDDATLARIAKAVNDELYRRQQA